MSDPKPAATVDFFEIVDRERIHDGFLKLDHYRMRQHLFGGGTTPIIARDVVVAHEAVGALCYDPDRDEIVMIEQARFPAGLVGFDTIQTEIVAGIKEPTELTEDVVFREVREETGLEIIGTPIPIAHVISTPGHSTENIHLFCARVDATKAEGVHGLAEEHEDIRILVLPFDAFRSRILSGQIANSYSLVAGYWLILNRDRLRSGWSEQHVGG